VFSSQLLERNGPGRRHTQGCSKKVSELCGHFREVPRGTRTVRDRELQTFDHPHPCSGFLF
jgi:hypothetical protein